MQRHTLTGVLTLAGLLAGCPVLATEAHEPPAAPKPIATYHVDSINGDDAADGLSPKTAWRTWQAFPAMARPGSALLLKRGCTFVLPLPLVGGSPGAPVTYGAYGDGPKPVLEGPVVNLSRPEAWKDEGAGLWCTTTRLPDVANVIFDDAICGNMRYKKEELRIKGEWFQDGNGDGPLLVHSPGNPAHVWRKVEVIPAGNGLTLEGGGGGHVRIEDLFIRKVGTHGIHIRNGAADVMVRRCDLTLIGGAVFRYDEFSRWYGQRFIERRVRYGNAIETWADVSDVTVEGCRISEIFDGGLCIQGPSGTVASDVYFRDNVIWNCGYDSMDVAHGIWTRNVAFEHNTCWNAGEGWALQGEPRPRYSLHMPERVGFHCNLESKYAWDPRCELMVRNNIFCNAPESPCFRYGPDTPSNSIVVDGNCYHQVNTADAIVKIGKDSFAAAEFTAYRKRTGWDQHSIVADPQFVDPVAGDFRLKPDSPCLGMGARRSLEPRAKQN